MSTVGSLVTKLPTNYGGIKDVLFLNNNADLVIASSLSGKVYIRDVPSRALSNHFLI